jgi:hypothetical protein
MDPFPNLGKLTHNLRATRPVDRAVHPTTAC